MTHIRLVTTTFNEALTLPALAKGCEEMGIDSWLILDDEESTDGTAELARDLFSFAPGNVIQRSWSKMGWKTLSDKRNWLMNEFPLTRIGADYLFITQSDEPPEGELDKDALVEDIYLIPIKENSVLFRMPILFKADWKCHWVGTFHEFLEFSDDSRWGQRPITLLDSPVIQRYGSNATKADRVQQARVLKQEADEGNPRAMFYLAQTYRDLGWWEQSICTYLRRANMTVPDEEAFFSLVSAATMMEAIDESIAEDLYIRAHRMRSFRKEPLYQLADMYQRHGNFGAAYKHAEQGLALGPVKELLWVNTWVEEEGLQIQKDLAWKRLEAARAVAP